MKILYILRAQYGAGGGAASFQYASILAKKHEVLVLESVNTRNSEKKVSYDENIRVIDIFAPTMIQQMINVYNEIRSFNPDIIHLIQSPYALNYVFFLKHLTSSSKWVIDFRSPHVGNKNSPALKRYFFLQFYVDKVLTHSIESLKTNLPLRLKGTEEIPPGIELSLFSHINKKSKNTKHKRFIFIGSISKSRKLEFLISTFGNFAEETKREIILDIYGYGNDYDRLQNLIEEKGLTKYIVLKGSLLQKELFKIIPEYDAGIAYVPYEFFNTAPSLKSLEYAASKINIIASDTLGHKEYNKTYGFNFKLFENTAESFKTILEDVIQHGFSNDHVVKNFKAVEHFDWKYIVEKKLQKVYKKLLNQ